MTWTSAERRAAAGLLLAAVLVNWHLLASPFVFKWDVLRGLGNPAGRAWANLPSLFSPAYYEVFWESSYHPLPSLLYFLNDKAFGADPIGLGLFKTLLMWAISLLIADAGRRELGKWSWAAAAVYLIHPMHSHELMSIMRHQLVAFFCLLGLWIHRRSGESGHPLRGSFGTALAYALGLMSKEYAGILPLLLLSQDWALGLIPKKRADRIRWLRSYLILGATAAAYLLLLLGVVNKALWWPGGVLGYSTAESPAHLIDRTGRLALELAAGPWGGSVGLWALLPVAAFFLGLGLKEKRLSSAYGIWIILGFFFMSGLTPIRALSDYMATRGPDRRYIVVCGAGYAWLLALGLKRTIGAKRWTAAAIPAALCLVLAAESLSFVSGRRMREGIDGCLGENAAATEECANVLANLFLSLPRLRERAPKEYSDYRTKLESSLGGDAAVMESYYAGAIEDPCLRASLYHLKRNATARDMLAARSLCPVR